jgi:hypothetical protein
MAIAVLCALGLVATYAGTAGAMVYKNPATTIKQGEFTAGVIIENTTRKVTSDALPVGTSSVDLKYSTFMGSFGFGIGSAGVIELHAGQLSGKIEEEDSASGAAFGASLRYNLGSGGNIQHGPIVAFHSASVSNDSSTTDVTQTDLGYGVAFAIGNSGSVYAGGVFSNMSGTLDITGFQAFDFEGDSNAGVFAGVEFQAGTQLLLGAEFHVGHDSAFGFYLDGKF